MTDAPVQVFDLIGPLPTGTTVLEASAGTGKTYTIAALAARYVAEGVARCDELLLVTFGRDGDRRAARAGARAAGRRRATRLADGRRAGPRRRRSLRAARRRAPSRGRRRAARRLARALADFDAATIATTHGFCQQVLAGLGVAGDGDAGAAFVEDVDDLRRRGGRRPLRAQVRRPRPGRRLFDRAEALRDRPARGRTTRRPDLEPRRRRAGSSAARLRVAVRRGRARRGRRAASGARGVITYDDLLTRLARRAGRPGPGAARAAAARRATGSCWSTSSRTPTRCSGRSCARAFHGARARWC